MNYKVSDIKGKGGGKEIVLCGTFTFRDHDTFFEIISLIKSGAEKKIVFNMAECSFVDSAACGLLAIAHDEAASRHVDLIIRGVKGQVRDMLLALRFDTLYKFEE
ncbi:MAG: STAS domain-containing protein [Alphaproteobacteria bacterium]|nr:STAS domain-containing protein [Alphaproteobacteria bacterium]